jgi:hypothetical protein
VKLNILVEVTEESILSSIDELTDNEKADLAIRFGEHGDLNYELILMSKLISTISKVYPPDDKSDIEMSNLSKSLLIIKPFVDQMTDL